MTDYRQHTIPGGRLGTMVTMSAMIKLATRASAMPIVRDQAVALVADIPARDYTAQAMAIRDWVGDHAIFLRDPTGQELLQAPELLLQRIQARGIAYGDCDDVAMLAAALGRAIGLKTAYVVLAFRSPSRPFSHVYAKLNGVDVDPTRPAQGLAGLDITRQMVVPF